MVMDTRYVDDAGVAVATGDQALQNVPADIHFGHCTYHFHSTVDVWCSKRKILKMVT